jgi:endonuclease G
MEGCSVQNLKNIEEAKREIRAAAIGRWFERESIRQQVKRDIELQGIGSADSYVRQNAFAKRLKSINRINAEIKGMDLPLGIERRMGPTLDWTAHAPNERVRRAGRPVARLVPLTRPNIDPIGFGTGFLISPDLLITNWHVFPSRADAEGSAANFLYEDTVDGISRGLTFELDPKRFFVSSKELDFAIVSVAPHTDRGELLVDLGQITLIETRPKILRGHPINIIQYPHGGTKKYATSNNRLLDIIEEEGLLHYETDTLEGSSGSPAFSSLWELVALHHMSIPAIRNGKILSLGGDIWREGMGDEAIQWIANEGIRISAIVAKLSTIDVDTLEERLILKSLLATTKDPIPEALAAISRQKMETNKVTESQQKLSDIQFQKENIVPEIQFNFSGPVTININANPQSLIKDLSNQPTPAIDKGIEASIKFDQDYEARDGYNPTFLDDTGNILVPIPQVAPHRLEEIYTNEYGEPLILKYHHFELVMNKKRRLQMWSAVNVDYSPERKIEGDRKSWGSDRWIPDPRIPANVQIFDADFYKPAGNIDRGHVVRREDNEWGDDRLEIEYANADTFHWTNCTPQHEAFNQSTPGQYNKNYRRMEGTWGAFENHLQKSRRGPNTKATIIAGPILSDKDPTADFGKGPIQYPIRFFKIICVVDNGSEKPVLKVFGFIFSQENVVDEFGIERFSPGKFSQYQVPLTSIEEAAGLEFDKILHQQDTMDGQTQKLISSIDDVAGVKTVID